MSHHYINSSVSNSICEIANNLLRENRELGETFRQLFVSTESTIFENSSTEADTDYSICSGKRRIITHRNFVHLEFIINYRNRQETEFKYLTSLEKYSYFIKYINENQTIPNLVEVDEENQTFRRIRLVNNDFLNNLLNNSN
tara:strand:- start:70 stop:495 length:426 start_codon:yes stop_codon:yes gene_type:complete